MRWPFPAALRAALLAVLAAASLSAQTPAEPACYRERLAALLTPVEEVLKTDVPILPSDSGAVLLNERLVWVDAQGLRTTVRHTAYKTLTDAAVQENSEIIVSFRKKEQKAYLITAETIQPDGSRQPVKPDAVFIQSPQRQAEYAIYDDQSELKMIFPNVKPGSVTHFIVVIEDLVAKLPCEFNQSFYWGGTWATGLLRYRIDLPGDMAKRLRIETVGKGVPAVKTVRAPEGRVNHTWTVRNLAGRRYEIEFPPPSQVGPAINSSTINSWDDIGRWYRGLLAGRNQPGVALARQVDEWTASVKTPSETIALLHQKVAEQVRYVGLEFGTADYQPHPCREVWENRYGDCKDKANLLVALLGYRGIKAHIALVQTEYLGLVDRRTPDFRVFNHAIVAIPQKSGGFLFCDPTITYSNPGMLSPGSSDSDVLVITDQGTQWVHTPAQIAGRLHYQFDLKLADSGELSGWITYTADGFYGASERDRFARLDTEDARSGMSRIARGFYRGAEIIDVARTETPSGEPYVIKAYFIVPGAAAGDGKQTLRFPSSTAMFSDLGDRADRETPFFMYQDNIRASATIALPPGLHPSTIPPPFRFEAPAGATRARWTFEKSICTTDLQVDTTLALLKPQDFGAFYRATQSLQTWLAQPVELTADTKLADQRIPTPELDLPLMPTGDGQIDLLDRRYPESGNQEMRRLALERTIQYFPDDKTTVFRASVRLAVIDWNADRTQAAHDRLNALLVGYAGKIKPDTFAWAEILDGLMLRDLQRDPEAIARLRRVACDPALPDSRRAEACVEAADLIMKQTPADALKLLLEVAALPDGATPSTEKRIAHLLLITDQTDALRTRLAHVVQSRPDSCEELFIPILEAATKWKTPGDADRIQRLVDIVDAVRPNGSEPLRKASEACRLEGTMRLIHGRLVELLAARPLSDWYTQAGTDHPTSLAEALRAIEEAAGRKDPAGCLRLSLKALASHGTEEDFPHRLWKAASYAEWLERQDGKPVDEKVCSLLLDLCEQLPSNQEYYLEGRLLRADRLALKNDRSGEQAILREVIDLPNLPPSFLSPAGKKLGMSLEASGDPRAALIAYKRVEPVAGNYGAGADCLLRAALINLHLGQDDEAVRLFQILGKQSDANLKAAAAEAQIRELAALVATGRAKECWNASRAWWPDWIRFANSAGLSPDLQGPIVPLIPSLTNLGESLGYAKKVGNTKTYFQHLATLASAARWQPSLGPEVASLQAMTVQMVPSLGDAYRKLVIAVLAAPHPSEIAGLRNRQLLLAANYFDDHQAAETLRVVGQFNSVLQPNDAVSQAMHRVHALAALALGQELEPTAAALAGDLADPNVSQQRAMSVGFLFDLYGRLGRKQDQEQLLQRELNNPVIAADADGQASLVSRREQLTGSPAFTGRVDAWIKSASLPWYDFAEPQSLDDPRLQNLEEVLKFPDPVFQRTEQVKLLLLAARDARRPLASRQQSFRDAIRQMLGAVPDYARLKALASSVIDNSDFDEETRLRTLWTVLAYLSEEGRRPEYDSWRKLALCERFNANTKEMLAVLDQESAVDQTSSPAVLKLADTLAAQPMTSFGILIMNDLLGFLLRLGDIAGAEKLAADVPGWKLAPDVASGSAATQLEYARRIRLARKTNAVHEAMAAVVATRFSPQPDQLPEEFRNLRIAATLPTRAPGVTFQACLRLVKTRQFNRGNLEFWATFLRNLPRNGETENVIGEFFHAGLQAAPEDELRSEVANLFFFNVDGDQPGIRKRLAAESAAYRHPVANPLTYQSIRFFEITLAFRLGEAVDLDTAFSDLSDPRAKYMQQFFSIRSLTQKRDRVALQRTIDQLNADFLVNPNFVTTTIPAMELLGMDAELKVARDVARREIRKAVWDSWGFCDDQAATRTVEFAELAGDASTLPAAWVTDHGSRPGDPRVQHQVALIYAFLKPDWTEVERQAAALNRDYSTYYHFYLYRGLALHHLGRDREAAEVLGTYTRYCKDELKYPQAVELLRSLRPADPKTANGKP